MLTPTWLPPTCAVRPRRAFTLVELLVAMGILAFLAGLAVLIVANLDSWQRAPAGASQVQQALLIAKQRALRDRRPHGLRLIPDKSNPNIVREFQYIEPPDDFAVQPGVVPDPLNPARLLAFRRIIATGATVTLEPAAATAADFTGGQGADATLWPVQVGDYIEINGGGLPRRINAVTATTLTVDSPFVIDVPLTGNYRIVRRPRTAGDEPQLLPEGVIIDLATDKLGTLPRDPLTGTIDILFAPSGAVIGRGSGADSIYLWVRDETLPLYEGDNTIVVIHTRSGALAAHPVDQAGKSGGDPYSLTKDGRASGI
ncbi:MAG: type II secretion system GspH family protein [Gemmataceae bacterium]|nr:type II secretion system GspH family protein [Gemmataceae bacterium]